MQLNSVSRKKLKQAKTLVLPKTVAFETGKVYLVGTDSEVRIDIEDDLFSSLVVNGFLCYEGESVSSIINLLAEGNEFTFQGNDLEISSTASRSSYRSTSSPSYRVPDSLRSYSELTPSLTFSITNVTEVAKALEFVSLATKAKKGGVFTDRIFISDHKGTLSIKGTNNAVLNVVECDIANLTTEQDKTSIILAGKPAVKVAKLLKEEQLECLLTTFDECAILYLKGLDMYIRLDEVIGDTLDIEDLMKEIATCEEELQIESASMLIPPKEMLSGTDNANIEITSGSKVRVLVNHPGGKSSYDTEIDVSSSITSTNLVIKSSSFFQCLLGMSESILIQWHKHNPAFISLSNGRSLSIHALVMGEK